ncbi:TonB-dependent receptor domain-containing protein [Roseateles sp. BYS180W]|uniref:TonB-dependent receptor domain-containing protein n=1 Tax=Roseateles rivi TaxID=3299028 RepID=A0ABW7FTF4_9BURK
MLKKHPISTAAALLALSCLSLPALAQQQLERVEVTGSSIKRIASEGALPVITLDRKAIEQSGATTVTDLIQQLPSMQGFTTASDSINGGGGGVTNASLRNLGAKYTLVLLNGRRVAPYNSGSTVNLEQLPLSVIERVEILADGASALYGADAVAGVVNFITKTVGAPGAIELKFGNPEHGGGKEVEFSLSKGFGDLERNGYAMLVGASVLQRDRILASQRDFSKTGVFPFSHKGKDYLFFQSSINGNPPNVEVMDKDFNTLALYNPVLMAQGNCGSDPSTFKRGDLCRFDYASTVEMQPASQNRNLFLSGAAKLGQNWKLSGEFLYSNTSMLGRFAPPAQPLDMKIGGTLYNRYVAPNLAALEVNPADVANVSYYMRVRDGGLRSDDNMSRGVHAVASLDGTIGAFDTSFSYTHSKNTFDTHFAGGYLSRLAMDKLIDEGKWDPFAQGTEASRAALAPALLSGSEGVGHSSLDTLSARASGSIFKAPGGDAYLGFGADVTRQKYDNMPAPILQGPNALQPNYADFPVGGSPGSLPFNSSRDVKGAFGELLVPLAKWLEVTGAARWDSYSAVKNAANFDAEGNPKPAATQGNAMSATTYKLSARFQPVKQWMARASYGTGFRAPSMGNVTDPLQDGGVTNSRDCPVPAGDQLAAGCRSDAYEYKVLSGGNATTGSNGLRAERSKQWTIGTRFEPTANFTMGLDLWDVRIKDQLTTVPEATAFANFATYRQLFTIAKENGSGTPVLTYIKQPLNGAVTESRGLDWDLTLRNSLGSWGTLTTSWNGTYLLDSYFDLGFGKGKETSIGKFGSDSAVAFRVISRLNLALKTGKFNNALTWHYRPGYKDQSYSAGDATVYLRNADGSRGAATAFEGLDVPSYNLFDYQGSYQFSSAFGVTLGVKNLFDKTPPMSLKTVGGNMVGFDPRYADGVGRSVYLQAQYKF